MNSLCADTQTGYASVLCKLTFFQQHAIAVEVVQSAALFCQPAVNWALAPKVSNSTQKLYFSKSKANMVKYYFGDGESHPYD